MKRPKGIQVYLPLSSEKFIKKRAGVELYRVALAKTKTSATEYEALNC
jgi:hypothetical protein